MGSRFSKESNTGSAVIQELPHISSGSGSGEVMIFQSGYEKFVETTIMWKIENLVVGGDSFEHSLHAKIGGAVWSVLLSSLVASGEIKVTCSSKFKSGKGECNKRRFSVNGAIHGPFRKETFESSAKGFRDGLEMFCMEKDKLLSFLSKDGSLVLELTVTVFQEKPVVVVGTKKNTTSTYGASAKVQVKLGTRPEMENPKPNTRLGCTPTLPDEQRSSRRSSSSVLRRPFPKQKSGPVRSTFPLQPLTAGTIRSNPEGCALQEPMSDAPVRDSCKISHQEFQKTVLKRVAKVRREAEVKRMEGLRRIMDMHSRTGISPLDLLPREIWAKILDKLKPHDRANMSQVHHIFGDLMESTGIQDIQFPLVMQYGIPLVQGYPTYYTGVPPRYSKKNKEELEQLMLLRQVSRSLRESVDKRIEDRLMHFMRNSRPRLVVLPHHFDDSYRQMLNTVDFLGVHGTNVIGQVLDYSSWRLSNRPMRFFLRSLRVKVPARELTAEETVVWNQNVTEFLRNVGDQIWHLDLYYVVIGQDLTEYSNLVRKWLLLVPNLKWLVLEAEHLSLYRLSGTYQPDEPMPKLYGLERFDMCGPCLFPLGDAILSSNRHIKSHTRYPQQYIGDPYANYESLSTISLEAAYYGWGNRSTRLAFFNLPVLEQDAYSNWKLKRIELWLDPSQYTYTRGKVCMDDILGFIQKFQSLEDVQLHLYAVRMGNEVDFLRLPNLKNFWIEFDSKVESSGDTAFFHSLQFLFHCSKLRTLIWKPSMRRVVVPQLLKKLLDSGPSQGIMIDFNGGYGDLSGSNIWDVFPQLRSITVKSWNAGGVDQANLTVRKYLRGSKATWPMVHA